MARQVYADSVNFFYSQENIRPQAFANLYAEKLEKWADSMFLTGKGGKPPGYSSGRPGSGCASHVTNRRYPRNF